MRGPGQLNELLRGTIGEFVVHGDGTVSPKEGMSATGSQEPPSSDAQPIGPVHPLTPPAPPLTIRAHPAKPFVRPGKDKP